MTVRVAINGFGRMVVKPAGKNKASRNSLGGIPGSSDVPLVSIDYNGNPLSSIVDASCTRVIGDTMVRGISWCDNELRLIASKK